MCVYTLQVKKLKFLMTFKAKINNIPSTESTQREPCAPSCKGLLEIKL